MKKLLILSLALFINCSISNAQYSLFSHKNNKKSKKEVVKADAIKDKTKGCEVFDGLFKIYQNKKNGKSFIEIDTSHLDKEFIYFSYIENGVTDAGAVKGSYRGSKIIKISKFYNKIDFTINNTRYYFDEESQLSKASNTNINTPLIISEEIIVKNGDKTRFLINADNIFLNESLQQVKYSYPGGYKGFRLGNLSKSKTRYNKIRNYPDNTDVVVNYYYESKYPSRRGGEAITDSRNVSVLVQHSLVRMPDDNYIPRVDDTRVGFFTTQSNHMTTLDQVNYRDFINRWRLEKKDPTKELSEPIKPIVYWIENTTPLEFRDIIKEGVERWNIAFKEAGFIDAVQVKIQPDTAEWDAGDIRYNVLRWTSSPNPPWGGYGPSFVNPRTGEILGADIMLEWSYVTNRIVADNLYNDNNLEDKNCCSAAHFQQVENSLGLNYIKNMNLGEEMEEELVKQSLYRLVLHEVGHTIGLNHNFKASALLTTDELNNKEIVDEKGVTSSVMDYPAININKNPENQALFFDVKPGIYDIWAIQFGYTQFIENDSEGIDKILSRSTEKELAFANDALDMRSPGKGSDPNAMIYDLSSNQLDHSVDKINMVVDILKNLKSKYTSDNDTYEELYRSYINLVYSYYQALNIVTRQIGGVYIDLSHTDQNSEKKPFESVDKETQKKAMDILAKYAFSNKILLQEDLFPYLMKQRRGFNVSSDPTIHQRILRYQNFLLNHLLNSRVLLRISNSSLYGNEYKLPYYMIDLRNSIFASDIDKNVSTIRQNIQVSYVNRLLSIVNSKSSYDNLAKTSAYYNLNWLKDNLDNKLGNLQTRQHKDYILYLIESLENSK
ncbi:zinc-dependent metalloprotease [Flavobacteriales bacterium]|nr:zinc-dependent metalloprotease [Flavobacteriales bacterium]